MFTITSGIILRIYVRVEPMRDVTMQRCLILLSAYTKESVHMYRSRDRSKKDHNGDMTWKRVPWASCQIRKNTGCACAGNVGNVFSRRRFQRKLLYSDPGMHHGTCVTHVPWCMSGSLTCGDGENVPGIPGACASAILRIWQEAHITGPLGGETTDCK